MMSGKYQKEQLETEARLREVTETLNESYEKSQGIRDFLSLIRNYQGLKELDATVVNALIDKILVSEREKSADGTIRQEIKIYYKFIGFVGELHITPTKRWTALPAKHCTVCGVEYVPGSGISKYCPACAKRIQREKSNESKRRSREQKRIACIELSVKNDRLCIEQREGRGKRQGNENKEIAIYRYVTKNTFDAYLWSLVENKIVWFERGFEYLIDVLIRFACKQVLSVYTLTNQPHSCCRSFSVGFGLPLKQTCHFMFR